MPGNDFWVLAVPPHPDDECLTGLLPLRLAEECEAMVAVWAATYGCAVGRREERRTPPPPWGRAFPIGMTPG